MRFSTTMFQTGHNTGIEVPADVVEALGAGKRPPVVVTVNGYSYRSTVAPMGGQYLLAFKARAFTGRPAVSIEPRRRRPRRDESGCPRRPVAGPHLPIAAR
jgi:hypothetical protein